MSVRYKARLIAWAVERYNLALSSEKKFSVSRISKTFGRGKGRGREKGQKLHRRLLNLDPYGALDNDYWASPFPLAWRFRFGWVYGICDELIFVHGAPRAVIEYKSYSRLGGSELAQASIYGLLAMLNFASSITVYIASEGWMVHVDDWKERALEALYRFSLKLHRNV